jgi:cytochrome c oxidase cbb3-type subunit 3
MQNKKLKLMVLPLFLLGASVLTAAVTTDGSSADPNFYNRFLANGLLIFSGVMVLGALFALLGLLNAMIRVQQIKIYKESGAEAFLEAKKKPGFNWNRLIKRWTKAVPVTKEQDVMLDHDYDGIRELDNSLPPWWVAMFYITIAFGVSYFTYYHISGAGLSSSEQYEREMEQAEERVQAYLSTQEDLVDETNVVMLEDELEIDQGKTIFDMNCAACHGFLGEGGVGPNLTDDYWVHGGSIKDVFATVKYGVPEMGMISWKSQLSAGEMQKVSSYILTLRGTNPPNAKEAQGDLYQPEEEMTTETDSTMQVTEESVEGQ